MIVTVIVFIYTSGLFIRLQTLDNVVITLHITGHFVVDSLVRASGAINHFIIASLAIMVLWVLSL